MNQPLRSRWSGGGEGDVLVGEAGLGRRPGAGARRSADGPSAWSAGVGSRGLHAPVLTLARRVKSDRAGPESRAAGTARS